MGSWGPGPFQNDAAADFLGEAEAAPARSVSKRLREIAKSPADRCVDIDDGGAGWAACELVASAFGYGDASILDDRILDLAGKLRPKEADRSLALQVLARLVDRATSELAQLWHEGADGARFDDSLAELRARLESAASGPRESPKAKVGDVIVLAAAPEASELIVVQVVGPGEVAVFEGTCQDEQAALAAVKDRAARRVPTSVNRLLRRGRTLENVAPRKDLRTKKQYAGETGSLESYFVSSARAGGLRIVSYDEARTHDLLRSHDEDAIREVALGKRSIGRVRSPDELEAKLRARNAEKWAARREATTPTPFGDIAQVEGLLRWIEEYGMQNLVDGFHNEALGATGYGRPNEDSERGSYLFAGLVALWRGTWAEDRWPSSLAGRLPVPPAGDLMVRAVSGARILASRVITRDAELRLIWDGAADAGAAFRDCVAALQVALEE